ncbi:hypothetical protein [Thalassotalea aquiviva]|uniref:hypothetical protein n=1 Tax=Thalassotalea aquiviva TaxID=3242415 RepID=UPI00352A97DB
MQKILEDICDSLDDLSLSVEKISNDDRNINDMQNSPAYPALNRHDLAYIPTALAEKIRIADLTIEDETTLEYLEEFPDKIKSLKTRSVPNLFHNSYPTAISSFLITLELLETLIDSELTWIVENDNKAMPPAVHRRLKTLNTKIQNIEVDEEDLTNKIKLINEAHETAESLPSDLEDLKKARIELEKANQKSIVILSKIEDANTKSKQLLESLDSNKVKSDKLVENCEDAYRVTTSKGLAGAFEQRATKMAYAMWVWVIGLLLSLWGIWHIGSARVDALTTLLAAPNFSWGTVAIHLVLAFISLGAPLWFAWLSTKQINQRFKLAEDYGFKSSTSKAYEGYKREANTIDKKMESRLFESALARLEEPPLRLLENNHHSSPWHEFFDSEQFKSIMKNVPELRDKVLNVVDKVTPNIGKQHPKQSGNDSVEQIVTDKAS